MNVYDLPTSAPIGGKEYKIHYQWRAILDILAAQNDPELDKRWKAMVLLQIFYPDLQEIPPEYIEDAYKFAVDFIDCGQRDDGKPHPRLLDWQQDAGIIIPAINKVAGTEIRASPDIHWWTFWGFFMEIGESVLSSVVAIRAKKAKGKRLDKTEREYYRENKQLIDFAVQKRSEEETAALRELFGLPEKG